MHFKQIYKQVRKKGTQINVFEKTRWVKHAELQVQNGNEIKKNTPSMTFHFRIKCSLRSY
jgi:hypothetical protein